MSVSLGAQRRATDTLIREQSRLVILMRPTSERTAAGGVSFREDDATQLAAKRRHFAGVSRATTMSGVGFGTSFSVSSLGNRYRSLHVLIGPVGDDIQERDFFFLDGKRYEVVFVDPHTLDYQTKAIVAFFE